MRSVLWTLGTRFSLATQGGPVGLGLGLRLRATAAAPPSWLAAPGATAGRRRTCAGLCAKSDVSALLHPPLRSPSSRTAAWRGRGHACQASSLVRVASLSQLSHSTQR